MTSKDGTSDVIAKILYMLFLLNAVLLIMNMLIAVLTNTYQKVEDHAFHEWSYRKARTIRTYGQYHPVPVPFNIISLICLLFNCCCCKSDCDILRAVKKEDKLSDEFLRLLRRLESYYFAEYGYSFPLTDGNKLDLVLKETEGNRHLSGHIAENVFRQDVKRLNDQHWDFAQDFCVDGQQLFISSPSPQNQSQLLRLGARYCHPLSKERPGFEVLIKESGQKRYIAIGVADKQYDLNSFPGWTGNSAAFHVDDGKIFDTSEDDNKRIGKETGKMAHRGDVIGCVLMYDKVAQGKLPVCFTLNGTTVGEGHLNANQNFHPFIGIGDPEIKLIFRMPTTDQMQVLSNEVLSLTETMSQLMVQVTELSRLAKQGSFQTPINGRNTKPTSQAGTSPVFLDIRKDASTTGQLSSLKRNLLKTTMMPIFDQRPQMDGFITITKEICNEKDCWLARRDDKVIVPPMGVNHEQTMSSNLSRFLRFESALKQTTSPTDQRLLQGVDFTVKKVESMKSYGKHAAAKHSRTNEGLLKGIEITVDADEQQQQQQQLMSHLVDSDENLVNKSGDAFVFKVTNNNTEDVYISVLLYQLNGAVRILYPKDGFSGKLSNGCPVQDIHPVYLPKGCLRIMTQPDLSLGEPQMGSETLVLYASSKEFDLRALAQTPIKTDPDLTSMVYNKEQEVCDYQEFLRALAQFNDTATVDFQWMIEKRKLAVVKNETLP